MEVDINKLKKLYIKILLYMIKKLIKEEMLILIYSIQMMINL